jgi:predicted RNase H-like nuclease (RuvC/YqgF family)
MDLAVRQVYERIAPDPDEAIIADLAETIEVQEQRIEVLLAEVERLHQERRQLDAELGRAQTWIRELAAELENAPPEPEPLTFRERILAAQSM